MFQKPMKIDSIQVMKAARQGKILVLVAICLTLLFGIVACALDVGWVMMARTQLHAGADSACLAGGTELMPGLGLYAFKTPAQVATEANARAVEFAAKHYAGEVANIHVDAARDVVMGKAKMVDGTWEFEWGSSPYNAVQVTTRRSVAGSTAGDEPLPLIIAPAIGHTHSLVEALGTAVIMPSKGVQIPPGSGGTSALAPFAFKQTDYEKYKRAQLHFTSVLGSNPSLITEDIMDTGTDPQTPLYFITETQGGDIVYTQIFDDAMGVIDPLGHDADNITTTPDGVLEVSIYPTITASSGNFGTVDIGDEGNSAADLKRQIEFGPNEEDMSYFDNSTIDFSTPFTLNGDTGISAGIEASIKAIIGQCRAVVLYSTVSGPGNNAEFTIVDLWGTRIMMVKLSGSKKILVIQPCNVSDPGGLPDYDDDDGSDNSVFSPLILAQ